MEGWRDGGREGVREGGRDERRQRSGSSKNLTDIDIGRMKKQMMKGTSEDP